MLKRDVFKKIMREDFALGEKIANDRKNNILPDLSLLKTTVTSDWWIKTCPVCNDTFRENDLVRVCPDCKQAYHDDAAFGLHCWQKHFTNQNTCLACGQYQWDGRLPIKEYYEQTVQRPYPVMEEQFFAGLLKTWQTYGNAKIRIVKPGEFIVGNNCPMCQYKIRVGDRVAKCPCSPGCRVYFHNDVFRKWTCWNEWNGEKGKDYCPVSSKKYEQRAKPKFIRVQLFRPIN